MVSERLARPPRGTRRAAASSAAGSGAGGSRRRAPAPAGRRSPSSRCANGSPAPRAGAAARGAARMAATRSPPPWRPGRPRPQSPPCTSMGTRRRSRSAPSSSRSTLLDSGHPSEGGEIMATVEEGLTYEAVLEDDGLKVSKSPWGADDEIGRLNWITQDTNRAILEHLDGSHVFDLNVEFFIGMPSWVAAGDPPYGIWMTHTPQGSVNDNLSGVGGKVHETYSYCGDSIHMYTHCGTHIDTLNHLGFYGKFWNGWTADAELGSRIWNKGGLDKYPPIIARGVMLDVAGLHGVDCLDDGYAITPDDLKKAASEQGVDIQPKS